jgi:hypothetical protein
MLSPPAAKGSKQERFRQRRQPIGCEARHDLIIARAVKPKTEGVTARALLSEPHFGTPQADDATVLPSAV